jgi:hypothetical protein
MFISFEVNKRKNNKYHTVRTVLNYNKKIVDTEDKLDTADTCILLATHFPILIQTL